MKKIILSIALGAIFFTACSNNNANNQNADTTASTTTKSTEQNQQTVTKDPLKNIITGYLQLKNALVKDNGNEASKAAHNIITAIAEVNQDAFTTDQKKLYADVAPDLKENAEHINENSDKLDHQREHFVMLTKDVSDLLQSFGTGGFKLYKDFCPMANDNKGAIWISEVKEIQNPYMGQSSPTCGSLKEELK